MEKEKAILILEDGTRFEGTQTGLKGTTTGEIAFNTGMTGYQEIFTDPSYYGQVLVMATAHIGNYAVHPAEIESEGVKISGLVVKNFSKIGSRAGTDEGLQHYLERNGIVGIANIDTRKLVRHIRDKGAMNCIISSEGISDEELIARLKDVPSMDGLELSSRVSTAESYELGNTDAPFKVAVLDYGVKKNILRCLAERGCRLKVFPYNTSAEEVLAWEPDGIMLSNGPGDPGAMQAQVKEVQQFLEADIPMFGICLGHQVLCLALGMQTEKMHHGHRGINHLIKNLETGLGEITSQNHGFVVNWDSAEAVSGVKITHQHLNDGTLAGIRLTGKPVFSVQYHPESSPGPHDSRYLFDNFVTSIVNARSLAKA